MQTTEAPGGVLLAAGAILAGVRLGGLSTGEGRPADAPLCLNNHQSPARPIALTRVDKNPLIRLVDGLVQCLHDMQPEDVMGTVGLAFGSPTSGAGFNVSSTVAEIVGNLQNVETPWQNQLTTLESQDTVISNLGTLFSNLSNDMSSLTDLEGVLAQKEGSSSDTNVLELTSATSSAAAGTHTVVVNSLAQTSSGYMAEIANSSDTLSGSITLQVGSGTAQTFTIGAAPSSPASNTVYTGSGADTLADLVSAINSSGLGITANVLTDATGSRLSLVSGTSGANGNIAVTGNSIAAAASNTLSATVTAGSGTGSGSTTSTALLSPVASSSEQLTGTLNVTVGGGTEQSIPMSAVGGTTLADLQQYIYNNSATLGFTASLANNSDGTVSLQLTSGTPGTAGTLAVNSSLVDPSTALAYTSAVTGSNANLTVDGVNLTSASNTVSNLIPGLTFQLLAPSPEESDSSLEHVQVVISNDNSGVESTVNQFVSDYNSLISALNKQEGNTSSGTPEPLFGSPTLSLLQQELLNGLNAQNPNGTLTAVTNDLNPTLSGSISIQVGSGTARTVTLNSSQTSLSDLAQAINSAAIGVTAGVATSNGQSTLTLASQTSGSAGALTVNSSIVAASNIPLSYSGANATSSQPSQGTLSSIPSSGDTLSGSITVQVGAAAAQTINMSTVHSAEGGSTLADLEQYITTNSSTLGFSASLVPNSNGSQSLSLVSNTSGSSGDLTVGSSLIDTTSTTNTTLSYTNASDINSLTTLGISVNNDGSLTFDASSLDSVLNSDYSSVASFFQNANGWGQNFSNVLTNSGSSSSTGILGLAASANGTTESTLNAEISKEQSYISAQQSSLTTELNQANQILEELPSQLQGINELYSAITGYNQGQNG
jgi:flagellar hook-associated protein 2